jgi:hypothetical protein
MPSRHAIFYGRGDQVALIETYFGHCLVSFLHRCYFYRAVIVAPVCAKFYGALWLYAQKILKVLRTPFYQFLGYFDNKHSVFSPRHFFIFVEFYPPTRTTRHHGEG